MSAIAAGGTGAVRISLTVGEDVVDAPVDYLPDRILECLHALDGDHPCIDLRYFRCSGSSCLMQMTGGRGLAGMLLGPALLEFPV